MELETSKRFRNEVWSFFGLSILNLMIAAMTLALGMALAIPQVMELMESGEFLLLPLLLIGLGLAAIVAGFYWIIEVAEIIDGIDDIKTAYQNLDGEDDQAPITTLIIRMMAHYRSNRPTISRMIVLGRVGGTLFLIAGSLMAINAASSIASSGLVLESIGQLVGAVAAVGVGIAGLLVARYFTSFSKVWDARLQEAARIEGALQQNLEADR